MDNGKQEIARDFREREYPITKKHKKTQKNPKNNHQNKTKQGSYLAYKSFLHWLLRSSTRTYQLQQKWTLFMFRLASEVIPSWGDLMRWPAEVLSKANPPVILSNLPLWSRQLYKLLPALMYLNLITTMSTECLILQIYNVFLMNFCPRIYHHFQKLNYILGIILNVRFWNYAKKKISNTSQ